MFPVSIDFVAGSHGQFLEYVCNRFVAKHDINFSPFNHLGASHVNIRNKNLKFVANHYSNLKLPRNHNVVKISFTGDDLLLLLSGCFLRAGDSNIDVTDLNVNTYTKLKYSYFSDTVDQLNHSYNLNLSASEPDCPRHILREFFKFGFKNPNANGLVVKLSELTYPSDTNLFEFKFGDFYNTDLFLDSMHKLATWYGTDLNHIELAKLHADFLSRQRFRHSKIVCDNVIKNVVAGTESSIPELSILQESYIDAVMENIYGCEMPFSHEVYFNSTLEIVKYLNVQN